MWVTSLCNESCCHCSPVSKEDNSSGGVSWLLITVGLVGFLLFPHVAVVVAGTD